MRMLCHRRFSERQFSSANNTWEKGVTREVMQMQRQSSLLGLFVPETTTNHFTATVMVIRAAELGGTAPPSSPRSPPPRSPPPGRTILASTSTDQRPGAYAVTPSPSPGEERRRFDAETSRNNTVITGVPGAFAVPGILQDSEAEMLRGRRARFSSDIVVDDATAVLDDDDRSEGGSGGDDDPENEREYPEAPWVAAAIARRVKYNIDLQTRRGRIVVCAVAFLIVGLVAGLLVAMFRFVPQHENDPPDISTLREWFQVGQDIIVVPSNITAVSSSFGDLAISLSANGTHLAVSSSSMNLVQVYRLSGGDKNESSTWTTIGSAVHGGQWIVGSISLSMTDDGGICLAIGAPYESKGEVLQGKVRIYEYYNGTFVQRGLDINGEAQIWIAPYFDRFGHSVSLSSDGSRIAIGAPGHIRMGRVQVWQYQQMKDEWVQMGSTLSESRKDDSWGQTVSISRDGTRIAAAGPYHNENGPFKGWVQVFDYVTDEWTRIGDPVYGEVAGDASGEALSMSSDGMRVAVGAPAKLLHTGQVRMFQYSEEGSWVQLGQSLMGERYGESFGKLVSLSADGGQVMIATGTNGENATSNAGDVQIYEYDSEKDYWIAIGAGLLGEGYSIESISLSAEGNRVAIGAHNFQTNAGVVRIYDVAL